MENDVVNGESCGVVCSIGSSADELINPKGRPPKIDGWEPEMMFLFEGSMVFFQGGKGLYTHYKDVPLNVG